MTLRHVLALVLIWLAVGGCASLAVRFEALGLRTESDFHEAKTRAENLLHRASKLEQRPPQRPGLALVLSQIFGGIAFLVVEDEVAELEQSGEAIRAAEARARALNLYRRGRAQAVLALRLREPRLAMALGGSSKTLWQSLTLHGSREHVAALYWYVFNQSGVLSLGERESKTLADTARLVVIAQWLTERKPGYAEGGPLLILGALECSVSAAFGGSRRRGAERMSRAEALAGPDDALMIRVLRAQYCLAGSAQERYRQELRAVANSPRQGGETLVGAAARRRAIRLLRSIGEVNDDDR